MVKRLSIAFLRLASLASLVAVAGCTVHQTTAPTASSPSEFATSVGISAQPDSINQDGGSQSTIHVTAHGPTGELLAGQVFRLDLQVDGTPADYGTLSARTIVTGSDGVALAIYTAPPAPPSGSTISTCRTFNTPGTLGGGCVTIVATPASQNFQTSQTQSVEIRLNPVGIIGVPTRTPTAVIAFSPTSPAANSPVAFDGGGSCAGTIDSSSACVSGGSKITSYQWSFGDGATASGPVVSHTYSAAASYNATLTVTNDSGGSASATKAIPVGVSGTLPTAAFVFSPTSPIAAQAVFFNADASRAGSGRTLTQFSWNFGDPASADNTASGFQVTHAFSSAGTYAVVLSVADDVGQKTTTTTTVTVGSGAPTPSFVASFSGVGHTMNFDGSGSTAQGSATIATYSWAFGDGGFFGPSGVSTASRVYATSGTFTVRLTVTDSLGRSASTSQSVTVP